MKSHAIFPTRDFPDARSAAVRSTRTGTEPAHRCEDFVDDYLPALLAQAHHLLSSQFHVVAGEHGLTPSEWRVLATLARGQPMAIGELAAIVVLKQPTVTRVLDRMEGAGQVRRVVHEADRRVTLVELTPAGLQLARRLLPLARQHEERVLRPFGAAQARELKRVLRQLIDSRQDG